VDWFAAVDIYCERTDLGFWGEPFNALSNAAFPLAAFWAAAEARQRATPPVIWVLIAIAAMIGAGSFLFHSFANTWSGLADVIPIWSFVALFIFVAIQRIGGVQPGKLIATALAIAAVLTAVFLATGEGENTTAVAATVPDPLNGSQQYAPALLALLVFCFASWRRKHPMRNWILAATLIFMASLVFRTIDPAICAKFPRGSHFMWHILNGVMIGTLLQGILRTTVVKHEDARA
jgi:hypothetical protein